MFRSQFAPGQISSPAAMSEIDDIGKDDPFHHGVDFVTLDKV